MFVQHADGKAQLPGYIAVTVHQHSLAAVQIFRHAAAAGGQYWPAAAHGFHCHKPGGFLHQGGHADKIRQAVIFRHRIIGHIAGKAHPVAKGLGLLFQLAQERALLGTAKERAAHNQQLDARVVDILHRFQQLVDALIRLQAAAEQYNKIFRGKAEGSPQRSIRRAGHKAGGINAVVQDVGMLAVQLAGF